MSDKPSPDELWAAGMAKESAAANAKDAEIAQITKERDELRKAIKTAINEFHHPGACRYEEGQDIIDFLQAALNADKETGG